MFLVTHTLRFKTREKTSVIFDDYVRKINIISWLISMDSVCSFIVFELGFYLF
jgi:hypothetical protein